MSINVTSGEQRRGIRHYRELCQKGDSENFLFDKYIFRLISIFPTILFIKLGVQPNTATFLSFVASVGSCFFLVSNEPLAMLIGASLVFIYYTLDHVDGELARFYIRTGQRKPSLNGSYFDLLVHSYSANLMLFCLGVSIYHAFGYWWMVYVGFVACIGASNFPFLAASQALMQKVVIQPKVLERPEAREALSRVEGNQRRIETMKLGVFNRAKLEKLVSETLDFPGLLMWIVISTVADIFIGTIHLAGISFNARLLLVLGIAFAHSVKLIVAIRRWLRALEPIG